MLEDFVNARLDAKASPNTINKELRHIKVALRWAWKRDLLSRVPDLGCVFIRVERKQPVIIPETDFVAMAEALKQPGLNLEFRSPAWWQVFLYLAFYVGLRRGEILGLCWEHIRFDAMEMLVSANTSKGRKDRVVPFNQELGTILLEWRAIQTTIPIRGEVLPWEKDSLRQLYVDWHAIQKAAGIPDGRHYVPKNCRSSCASALIAAGAPTVVVKDILGHATVATTETFYINTTPALRSAIAARTIRVV
jgi:integrase